MERKDYKVEVKGKEYSTPQFEIENAGGIEFFVQKTVVTCGNEEPEEAVMFSAKAGEEPMHMVVSFDEAKELISALKVLVYGDQEPDRLDVSGTIAGREAVLNASRANAALFDLHEGKTQKAIAALKQIETSCQAAIKREIAKLEARK